jgi:hypothetical protein
VAFRSENLMINTIEPGSVYTGNTNWQLPWYCIEFEDVFYGENSIKGIQPRQMFPLESHNQALLCTGNTKWAGQSGRQVLFDEFILAGSGSVVWINLNLYRLRKLL